MARAIPSNLTHPIYFLLAVMIARSGTGLSLTGVHDTQSSARYRSCTPCSTAYANRPCPLWHCLQDVADSRVATPPLGLGLFIVATHFQSPFEEIVARGTTYFIPLLIVLAILATVPEVSLWLPSTLLDPPTP